MREFRRKLSVILAVAMVLALIPGAGAREITARAAEAVEGLNSLSRIRVGYDGVLYREMQTGGAYEVEFATASNAKEFMDAVNENPDDVIKIEVVDESGKPVKGFETGWWEQTAYSYEEVYGEEDNPNVIILQYSITAGKDAPDSAFVKTTVGSATDTVGIEIRDIPAAEKIQVANSRKVEVGKTISIPIKVDNKEALPFVWSESDEEKNDRPENQRIIDYWWEDENTVTVVGVKEGTSTIRFWVEGSDDVEVTTTITVMPRTMTLSDSEVTIDMDNDGYQISIDDIGLEDIFHNGTVEWEDGMDSMLVCYGLGEGYQPVWKVEDETVAALADLEGSDPYAVFAKRIVPLKAGTTTITVEWRGAKAEATLTVTGRSLDSEIHRLLDEFYEAHEGPILADWLREKVIPQISNLVSGKALTSRVWNALNRLNGEVGNYVIAYDYRLDESENTVGLLENIEYFGANMPLPAQAPGEGEPWNRFWVTMGDAAEADVNAVSGTGKTGFAIGFKEGIDEEHLSPITELKIPVRVTLAIPEDLADAAEKDLVVYYVGSAAARSASGAATELPSGYVVKKGGSILLQIDQPGTYVLAKRISKTPSSSGGYSYSSGSASRSQTTYTAGWVQNETGWWYRNADGTWPANTWAQLAYNGRTDWYHFDANGYMQTGWFTDTDGRVYYLNPVSDGWMGSMFVGNHVIDGKSYYFNEASDGYKGALVQ